MCYAKSRSNNLQAGAKKRISSVYKEIQTNQGFGMINSAIKKPIILIGFYHFGAVSKMNGLYSGAEK